MSALALLLWRLGGKTPSVSHLFLFISLCDSFIDLLFTCVIHCNNQHVIFIVTFPLSDTQRNEDMRTEKCPNLAATHTPSRIAIFVRIMIDKLR